MLSAIERSRRVIRNEGLGPFLDKSKRYTLKYIKDQTLKYRYRLQYGTIAPRPDERLWIDPTTIEHYLATRYLEEDRPRYGILDGSWDLNKTHWTDSAIWSGLRERFEKNKPWEETAYYQKTMENIESGGPLGFLDGPHTEEYLEEYLDYLDRLHRDIKYNGYDPTSVITVHIGRGGEWMVGHGNHRANIASVIGVESVPIRIKYRHTKWQEIRRRFYDASSAEEIRDIEEYRDHPDVPDGG